MEAVATVAYLQSDSALDFARYVVDHLEPDPLSDGEERIFLSTRDSILRKLSQILKASAHNESSIRASLELLWQLRNEHFGEPLQQPEHPIRVLQEIAGFENGKPDWVYESVLGRITTWLRRAEAFEGTFSPLDVIDALLKREGSDTWVTKTEGPRVHWQGFQVQVLYFGPFRQQALDLLEEQASQRTDPRVRYRILKSLAAATWSSHELAGTRGGTPNELDARLADNTRIMHIISSLLAQTTDSMLGLLAAEMLYAKVIDKQLSPREKIIWSFLEGLPSDERTRLTLHLWQGPVVRTTRPGPWRYHNDALEETRAEADTLAQGLLSRYHTAEAIKQELDRVVRDVTSYGEVPEPGPFLARLVLIDPVIGRGLTELVIDDRSSALTNGLVGLLRPLREQNQESYHKLLDKMINSGDLTLVRLGATAVSRSVDITEQEVAALKSAAQFKEPTVVSATIQALSRLIATDPDEALRLVAEIDFETDADLADDLCEVLFDLRDDAPAIDLPSEVVSSLLTKCVALKRIQESRHHLRVFLDWLSRRDPISVVGLFLNRIRRYCELGTDGTADYQPVPYASFWTFPTRSADPDARKAALRLVRDAALDPDLNIAPWLSNLFVAVAGGLDDAALSILSEWLESDDPTKIVWVARLLRSADPDFVFNHEGFTVRLLDAAEIAGTETLDVVTRYLGSAASSRGGSGTPGEPMPHWIKLRDQAQEVGGRYSASSAANKFFASLEDYAIGIIEHDRKSWEEDELS